MVAIVNIDDQEHAMNNHCPAAQRPTGPPTTSALLGTSLLVTRAPRHNRALNGLLRVPTGRVT